MIIQDILFLAAGLALIIKAADYLIDGASSIARRLGISTLVIGLTVVAFGTSTPELAVSLFSALKGNADIAVGNINGSNIANILLVLGATALISRVPVQSRTVIKEAPYMLLAGGMLVVLMLDRVLDSTVVNVISRTDGAMLLGFFVIFCYYLFLSAKDLASVAKVQQARRPLWLAAGMTVMGVIGLVLGGHLTVNGGTGIASALGVSDALIGLTLVAVGTSLPEFVTSIVAARKGEPDLAVGNVVGSNIFNILFVLGTTAVVRPIVLPHGAIEDAVIALVAMAVLIIAMYVGNGFLKDPNKDISRREGALFLLLYAGYIVYIVIRG